MPTPLTSCVRPPPLHAQGQRLRQESKGIAERDGAAAAGARDAVLASFFGDDGVVAQLPALCGLIYRGVARGMLDLEVCRMPWRLDPSRSRATYRTALPRPNLRRTPRRTHALPPHPTPAPEQPVVSSIRNRSWAPKEIGTQHSPYVDQLLSHVQSLQSQLEAFGVPPSVQVQLMGEVVQSICEQLVDGYSHIKKVSDNAPPSIGCFPASDHHHPTSSQTVPATLRPCGQTLIR